VPLASGLGGQLGLAEEVTYGTYVAPARYLEFNTENVNYERERIESAGIRAGRRVLHRWAQGIQRVQGRIVMECAPQGNALLWKHILGSISTSGTNPYTHTATPGDLSGKSLTLQIGRPDIGGTVRSFSYLGCKIASAELACSLNQWAMLTLNVYGAHEDTTQTLGTASYPATYTPFTFTAGSLQIAAANYDVQEFSMSIDNGLALNRHFIRATTPERPKEPLEANRRAITGTITSDFIDLTAYNRFVNGTEAAMVLTFNSGAAAQLTVTLNVRYDGETPDIGGAELVGQSLPWKALSSTSDAAAVTVAITNADTTP
jgi:Phage tail tube protein